MPKNTERFSDRVENYIKYRPTYPVEILNFLKEEIDFETSMTIADIGSGTGISAEFFLHHGNKVYAVEPNKEMRDAADRLLHNYPHYISVDGSSESTALADHSIDLIVAAQAFHWFDKTAFKAECLRIAKSDAHCLLIWNERKVASDFERAYEDLLIRYGTDYTSVDHRNIKPNDIALFFTPHNMLSATFFNEQMFDFDGVMGRLLSSSYAPNVGGAEYEPMMAHLLEIFDRYQLNGKISFSYDCNVFLGRIK